MQRIDQFRLEVLEPRLLLSAEGLLVAGPHRTWFPRERSPPITALLEQDVSVDTSSAPTGVVSSPDCQLADIFAGLDHEPLAAPGPAPASADGADSNATAPESARETGTDASDTIAHKILTKASLTSRSHSKNQQRHSKPHDWT